MNHVVVGAIVLAQLMDLGVAVVATCDAVSGTGFLDLGIFDLTVGEAFIFVARLEETTAATAAEVVALVGVHVDEVLFANNRFHNKAQVVCGFVAVGLTDDLAGILNGELDTKFFVPVRVDGKLAFADPLGVEVVDAFNFEVVLDVEFFQSCQD